MIEGLKIKVKPLGIEESVKALEAGDTSSANKIEIGQFQVKLEFIGTHEEVRKMVEYVKKLVESK